MKFKSILLISLMVVAFNSAPTLAATKPIKVLPAKPIFTLALNGNTGDQPLAATTTPISLVTAGVVESSTLGGSDGYISAVDFAGVRQWELKLGGAADDIASALLKEKLGGFWVAGTSAPNLLPPVGAVVDTLPVVNVDSVSTESAVKPNNSLSKLSMWRVSTTGQLQNTFTTDLPGTAIVSDITIDKAGYVISGEISQQGKSSYFTILMSSAGVFSGLNTQAKAPPKKPAIQNIAAGVNIYKSYISSGPIKGIPTWKPKSSIPVLIKYTKKGALLSANYLQGTVVKVLYQSGIGLVVITERSDGYGVTII